MSRPFSLTYICLGWYPLTSHRVVVRLYYRLLIILSSWYGSSGGWSYAHMASFCRTVAIFKSMKYAFFTIGLQTIAGVVAAMRDTRCCCTFALYTTGTASSHALVNLLHNAGAFKFDCLLEKWSYNWGTSRRRHGMLDSGNWCGVGVYSVDTIKILWPTV